MAKPKYRQHFFEVQNPEKYAGKKKPYMRSSWETVFARMCDTNPAVISWASEPFMIPYINPFTGKKSVYVPDFLVVYLGKDHKRHGEVIEVKPKKEAYQQYAKSQRDKYSWALNEAKWQVARPWCKAQGVKFRIVTEDDIFANMGGPPKTKKPRKNKRR